SFRLSVFVGIVSCGLALRLLVLLGLRFAGFRRLRLLLRLLIGGRAFGGLLVFGFRLRVLVRLLVLGFRLWFGGFLVCGVLVVLGFRYSWLTRPLTGEVRDDGSRYVYPAERGQRHRAEIQHPAAGRPDAPARECAEYDDAEADHGTGDEDRPQALQRTRRRLPQAQADENTHAERQDHQRAPPVGGLIGKRGEQRHGGHVRRAVRVRAELQVAEGEPGPDDESDRRQCGVRHVGQAQQQHPEPAAEARRPRGEQTL